MAQSPYLDQNAPEILALERQKKLADLLQARALEQPQGQMISGRYVALQKLPPSFKQNLALKYMLQQLIQRLVLFCPMQIWWFGL